MCRRNDGINGVIGLGPIPRPVKICLDVLRPIHYVVRKTGKDFYYSLRPKRMSF
jgi:hypothetical protein